LGLPEYLRSPGYDLPARFEPFFTDTAATQVEPACPYRFEHDKPSRIEPPAVNKSYAPKQHRYRAKPDR
jgi:hypothetical protein